MHRTILSFSSKFSLPWFMTWMLIFSMATLVGCGPKRDISEVTGVVMMDGKPMDLIHIEFWSKNGPRSYGKTDADGKFVLKVDDKTQQAGVIAGEQKVCLRDTWPIKDDYLDEGGAWVDMSDGKRSRIDTKYYDAVNSPMTVKVESGKKNYFELKVDPAR